MPVLRIQKLKFQQFLFHPILNKPQLLNNLYTIIFLNPKSFPIFNLLRNYSSNKQIANKDAYVTNNKPIKEGEMWSTSIQINLKGTQNKAN